MEVMSRLFGKSNPEIHEVMTEMALARPPVKSAKLQQRPADPKGDAYLAEYAELAGAIGIMPPDLAIESFKAFMVEHDLPIYSLSEVIAYMDAKAAKESKDKCGWEWRPLREKDHFEGASFGRRAERTGNRQSEEIITVSASDYYLGPVRVFPRRQGSMMFMQGTTAEQMQSYAEQQEKMEKEGYLQPASSTPYDHTIPLHAVRRVALIEKECAIKPKFFVCDYALAPLVTYPDPFLMAVVPNKNLHKGEGRFVIDFWDEPGFGIDKMLK